MSTRKGGKKMKRTTSVVRKVKRLRGHFRWKNTLSAEELDREFRAMTSAAAPEEGAA